jgi:hypothetical protein
LEDEDLIEEDLILGRLFEDPLSFRRSEQLSALEFGITPFRTFDEDARDIVHCILHCDLLMSPVPDGRCLTVGSGGDQKPSATLAWNSRNQRGKFFISVT